MFLLVPGERMGTTPTPPILPSETCWLFEVLELDQIGPDPIDWICGAPSNLIVASSLGVILWLGRKGRGCKPPA